MAKAATRLNMAQPAISKAVADLEHLLGVRLLDRSRQGVEPTAHGSALLKRGVAMFDELRQGVQDLDFLSDPSAGELRIGCTDWISIAIVSPLLIRLTERYPRVIFKVVTGDPPILARELTARNIELAISRVTAPADGSQSTEILFHDRPVVATGMKNPLTRRRKITLADLVDQPWAILGKAFEKLVVDSLSAFGLPPPHISILTDSINLRNEVAATGRFLTVLPGYALKLPTPKPSLRALPVIRPNSRTPVGMRTLQNRSLSPLAQIFIERVRVFTKPLVRLQAN
jgi:DNA-binding transcriptional LysR family regulator